MSLYHGAKTKVVSKFSEEFSVQVGFHQESVLSPLIFAFMVPVIVKNARKRPMNKMLCADNLVLLSERIENLKEKVLKWKEGFESKRLKVDNQKDRSDGEWFKTYKSKVERCDKCGKTVMENSVMCTKCGIWVHS